MRSVVGGDGLSKGSLRSKGRGSRAWAGNEPKEGRTGGERGEKDVLVVAAGVLRFAIKYVTEKKNACTAAQLASSTFCLPSPSFPRTQIPDYKKAVTNFLIH